MFDVVKCLLRSGYYYARFMGVINFDVDVRTGSLHWLMNSKVIHGFWSQASYLHEYVFMAILACRVLCIVFTIFTRWWQRRLYIRLVNSLQRIAKERPQVMRLWRRGVIAKVVIITLSEVFQLILSLTALRGKFSFQLFFGLGILSAITAQVDVIICQYYFALLNIHGHYILLNEELRQLLDETRSLETERRKGVYIIKCCALADRLDVIAGTQYQLQRLIQQILNIFGLQIMSMSFSYYMSTVGLIYFTFSELRASTITFMWSYVGLAVMAVEFVFYFTDVHITVNVIYAVLKVHSLMLDLLSQHAVIAHRLDERLEAAFESFQLQLALNPLKFSVLGLYTIKKPRLAAMGSSIVTNSLVLVQYDIQHF
ncbi:putative gustatory receptor 59d [Drosophila innubila]|uniref:putative gustatory receptor 59d n=1 Tax=Drosophila innubila TaxID=198719 RepID=UPI00148B5A45|nr:putative gustatory receptor 59d [Drosophila innubila]